MEKDLLKLLNESKRHSLGFFLRREEGACEMLKCPVGAWRFSMPVWVQSQFHIFSGCTVILHEETCYQQDFLAQDPLVLAS